MPHERNHPQNTRRVKIKGSKKLRAKEKDQILLIEVTCNFASSKSPTKSTVKRFSL